MKKRDIATLAFLILALVGGALPCQTLVPKITVSPKTATVLIGTTKTLSRTVTVVWTSSDTTIATVGTTGKVTPRRQGVVTISVTSGPGVVATSVITVPPPPVASVQVILGKSTLLVGEKTTATAIVRDALGNILTDRLVTWSSSNPNVATVTSSPTVMLERKKAPVQRYAFDWIQWPEKPWQLRTGGRTR